MFTADQIVNALREQAVPLVAVEGWETRGKTGLEPVGTLNHHTASVSRADAPSLGICVRGRVDLPGPLCNFMLGRDAKCYLIARYKANHAGNGGAAVLDAVRRGVPPPSRPGPDRVNGNYRLWGIEVENDGRGEPYSPAQLDVLVRINAGLARLSGWNQYHSVHHREWTARKIDMSYHGDLREQIAMRILQPNREPTLPTYDHGQPAIIVYENSPEERFLRDYLGGATGVYQGQPLKYFQVIPIPRDHHWLPDPLPPVTVGLGTKVPGWGQVPPVETPSDRFDTLDAMIEFLRIDKVHVP